MTRPLVALPAGLAERLPRGRASAAVLTERYRAVGDPGELSATDLVGYATARFPATYAAATAALDELDAEPRTVLDVGSGLGATAAAVRERWPAAAVTCLERSAHTVDAGRRVVAADWRVGDATDPPPGPYDLVTAGYLLTELADPVGAAERLWRSASGALVLVEPGRRAAYEALMAVRERLLAQGAHVLAPCPHEAPCPLLGRDWCHVGQRLPRSAAHRAAKGAERSHEDEPFSYLVLSRSAAPQRSPRVIRRPERRKGLVLLTLCRPDGTVAPQPVPRSDPRYREAKDVLWGQTS